MQLAREGGREGGGGGGGQSYNIISWVMTLTHSWTIKTPTTPPTRKNQAKPCLISCEMHSFDWQSYLTTRFFWYNYYLIIMHKMQCKTTWNLVGQSHIVLSSVSLIHCSTDISLSFLNPDIRITTSWPLSLTCIVDSEGKEGMLDWNYFPIRFARWVLLVVALQRPSTAYSLILFANIHW